MREHNSQLKKDEQLNSVQDVTGLSLYNPICDASGIRKPEVMSNSLRLSVMSSLQITVFSSQ